MQDGSFANNMSSIEFEQTVKLYLEAGGGRLEDFSAIHRDDIPGLDGSYEVDIAVRFKALGADITVLVECKHHRNPIKRDVVQILADRLRSTGAHKGMIFATIGYQSGAIEYAKAHGIALVTVHHGPRVVFHTHGPIAAVGRSAWSMYPGDEGWVVCPGVGEGALLEADGVTLLRTFLMCPGKRTI